VRHGNLYTVQLQPQAKDESESIRNKSTIIEGVR